MYVQSDTLLLPDALENFRNMCIKTYGLDPAALNKTKVILDLWSDIDMLLMAEKDIRGGICHSIYRYAKANNKYMKNYVKIKNRHIFNIGM